MFYHFQPWSNTGAGSGHVKVDAGQMGNFLSFQLQCKTGGHKKVGMGQIGFVEVRCGANRLFFCYFQSQSKTGEVEKQAHVQNWLIFCFVVG